MHFRILTFGKITGPRNLILADPKTKGEGTEVELHLNNFAGPYSSATRNLTFLAEAGDDPKSVARVSVPAALGGRVLLIFLAKSKEAGGYSVLPIRDDASSFQAGERRFVNLSPYPIVGQIDERRIEIPMKKVTPVAFKAPPKERDNHEVVFYFQEKKKWVPLTSTVWPYDPRARSLVFFWWDGKTKRIRIQSIAELAPVAP